MSNQTEQKLKLLKESIPFHLEMQLAIGKAYNGALYPLDILSTAVIHRSMSLISGFCDMIEKKNFICAAPLVRLQLDNWLRFYAAWLVSDPHDFAMKIFEGKEVRKIKDKEGKFLTDQYLTKKLSKEYPWVTNLYRETSGYIHLSKKHIFNTIKSISDKDRSYKIAIGPSDTCIPEKFREEALDAMLAITQGLLRYLHGWGFTKANPRLTKNHEKQSSIEQTLANTE
jgi:hypothetical protein